MRRKYFFYFTPTNTRAQGWVHARVGASKEGNRKAATELGNGKAIELHRCHLGVKLKERRRDGTKPGAQLYHT